MSHPASVRAEALLTRIIEQLAVWARAKTVRLRGAEFDEVGRWANEARRELLAARGEPVRGHIPKAIRDRVLARANGRCEACGRSLAAGVVHVDHVIPVARYGATADDNLRAVCAVCNLSKGAREAS